VHPLRGGQSHSIHSLPILRAEVLTRFGSTATPSLTRKCPPAPGSNLPPFLTSSAGQSASLRRGYGGRTTVAQVSKKCPGGAPEGWGTRERVGGPFREDGVDERHARMVERAEGQVGDNIT
jgi:hypothetical protein